MYPKLTLQALEQHLQARFEEGFLPLKALPSPTSFKDMERATDRIVTAIRQHERITIVGDYDVDGVVSTTLLKLFFDEIGYPIAWVIPNRFSDGYGLSEGIIPRIEQSDLIVTVDNGIAAVDAAARCRALGIDLIITDHHLLPPQIPDAYAIVDPQQPECDFPYRDVCGAQIAWYMIALLRSKLKITVDMFAYMGLTAIAIIADMMPLRHINRAMVQRGLRELSKNPPPPIRAFMEAEEKQEIKADDVAFHLGPLINSAGRMDDASHAVAFLTATNIYDARVRLERLKAFNTLRKETEASMTAQAIAQVNPDDPVLITYGKGWHEGVVGIVASRVSRHYGKPAIILSHNEGILKGSGRSFGQCDLFALVTYGRAYLEKFGGHQAAIGLSLRSEAFGPFYETLQAHYTQSIDESLSDDDGVVGELDFSEISFDLTALIARYEPYGHGNPLPQFIAKGVTILQADPMGKGGEHLRFTFQQGRSILAGVQFKTTEQYAVGSVVDLIFTVNENHFRGSVTLQLMVEKVLPH